VASKSAYHQAEKGAEIEEALDALEQLIERLRATYEQYFLGIQKVAPQQLHTDAERRLRDLSQLQIKNTALRYRFATLAQKFGSYSTYWKRTLRMIEQGKYIRDLERVKRQAEKTGEAIPEEILAAMPKLMRDRVQRDRAQAMSIGERRIDAREAKQAAAAGAPGHVHRLDDALVPDDVDVDGLFAALTKEAEEALDAAPPVIPTRPAPAPAPRGEPPPSPAIRATVPPAPIKPAVPPAAAVPAPASRPAIPPMPPIPPRPQTTVASPPPVVPPRPQTTFASPPPPAARPGAVVRPTPAVAPPPEARSQLGPPPGMDDAQTRALYQRYLKARQLCGESNDGVTYDRLLRTLRSQSSKIMTDTRAKGVEFGVVIKDNKVVLKAKPKL